MPDNSANAAALRASGAQSPIFLSVLTGNQVLAATVTSFTSTALSITITSGSVSDVRRGFRVVVKTSGGAYKGTVAVRAGGTLDSGTLPIRETSRGDLSFAIGDVVTVFDDVYWLIDKIPTADESFSPDGLSVGTNNSAPPPVPVTGGVAIAELGASGYADVPMDSTDSYGFTATVPNSLTRSWSAAGATFQVGTSSSIAPTLRYTSAGKKRVDLTLTDPANSAARTAYVRVRVHDETDPPYEIAELGQPQADEANGWKLSVTLRDDVPLDSLPDLCPVAIWVRGQTFGAAVPSRSNILMIGVIRREQNRAMIGGSSATFEIISPLAAVAELTGFSKVMLSEASPDSWNEVSSLTIKRAIVQLVAFYTWLIEAGFDVVFEGFSDAAYSRLYIETSNPLQQLRELATGRAARVVTLRNGRIEVQGELNAVEPDDRDAVTVTYTVEPDDVFMGERGDGSVDFEREHKLPLATYKARGFTPGATADLNNALFARVPASPAPGNQTPIREKLIGSAEEVFRWCELFAAEANGVYQPDDESPRLVSPTLRLTFQGNYFAIFDFHREFIRLDGFGAATNVRGIDLDAFRWRFTGVSMQWVNGVFRSTVTLRAEAALPTASAVDDTPNTSETITIPSIVLPEFRPVPIGMPTITPTPTLPPNVPFPIIRNTLRLGIVTDEGKLILTSTGDVTGAAGGPTWEATTLTLTGTPLAAEQIVGSLSTLIIVTTSKIYKVTGVGAGVPTVTEEHSFASAPSGVRRVIGTCEADPDWLLVSSYHPSFGTKACRSEDGGDTWTEVTVSTYTGSVVDACGEISNSFDAGTDIGDATWTFATNPDYPFSILGTSASTAGTGTGSGGRTGASCARYTDVPSARLNAPVAILDTTCAVTSVSFWLNIAGNSGAIGTPMYLGIYIHDASKALLHSEILLDGSAGAVVTDNAGVCPYSAYKQWSWSGTVAGAKYVTISAYHGTDGAPALYIDDIVINAGGGSSDEQHTPTVTLNPRLPGSAYVVAFDSALDPQAWLTSDYGATWTEKASPNLNCGKRMGSYLARPYSDASKFFLTFAFGASPYTFQLMRVQGATQTVGITPNFSGTYYSMPGLGTKELAIARTNKNRMVLIGRSGGGATTGGVFTTINGGGSWAARLGVSSANAIWRIVEISSDGAAVYLVGEDTLYYSADLLAHTDDRSGNLPALAAGEPLKLFRWG